ncbi:diguanylate cyclase [Fusibacter bizertensis]|uniref:Diguanylate cyclase n=1 Tax=Fusibacter bizertensis TaxID=1488331 RepID=A0ABT6NE57_9FIRM|nr:HD domain-containing phosphohydrolase [Fusibacter bizertensis]MDH8678712.1 diguanylate cyclase [Fusibacter bizertensis]
MSKKDLRLMAENKLISNDALNNENIDELSLKAVELIIHDLKVHQIELEMQNEELKRIQDELDDAKIHYFDLYDLAPVGYLIVAKNGLILDSNLTAADMLGHDRSDLINHKFSQYIYREDQDTYYLLRNKLFSSLESQECELHMTRNDGTKFWVNIKVTLSTVQGQSTCRLIFSDISRRKEIEQTLFDSKEKYKSLVMSMDQGLALLDIVLDEEGNPEDYIFVDINDSFTRLLGLTPEMCIGKKIKEVMPTNREFWMNIFGKVALKGKPNYYENHLETTGKYYSTYSYSPNKYQVAVLISDIDDRIKREEQINYLSYHDQLTGLYNRRFYEEELKRLNTDRNLPLTIVMGDLNGLKLINDSFGHIVGDEILKRAAESINQGCRIDDIIARIGGDEFIIILPNTDEIDAEHVIARINEFSSKCKVQELALSISFGFSTKISMEQTIEDIFRIAEDNMYRHKLYESASIKNKMVSLIMNTLYEKNPREQLHSKRVSAICETIAHSMNFSSDNIALIKIAGLMHDIGKIGINEKVLNSTEKLSDDEWKEIQRHPEVSYRILNSCNEFSEIANFALEHHERWDGRGYPKGLKGEKISVQARIIAIADSFDAMTSERTYKDVLSYKDAIQEIKDNAGTQFDPTIALLFVSQFT